MGNDGDEPLEPDQQVGQMLGEAHMILPGLLSLLGLQIVSVFNDVFQKQLERADHIVHLVALCLLVTGAALVVTPAAYHRQVAPREVPANFLRIASTFAALALVPLMLALSLDVYLIARLTLKEMPTCIVLAACQLALFTALWFVFPWIAAHRRRARSRRE